MVSKKNEDTAAVEGEVVAENETTAVDQRQSEPAEGEVVGEPTSAGIRARRAFMLKQFLPNPDWINKNVVANGKGTRAVIGRIYGYATGTEDKTNTLPDGSVSNSIFVKGVFQSESLLTGELGEATGVFFPMAYAEKIKAVFAMGDAGTIKTVEVDCDIGLEATGKTIPYEWVVIAFREGKEMDALKRLRGSRTRPAGSAVLTLADGTSKPATDTKVLTQG